MLNCKSSLITSSEKVRQSFSCPILLTLLIPANGELSLMNLKLQGLERELEQERRKVREMQESARERDKEYNKLKVCSQPACMHFYMLLIVSLYDIEPLRQIEAQVAVGTKYCCWRCFIRRTYADGECDGTDGHGDQSEKCRGWYV